SHGEASKPQVGILVEYGDSAERGEDIAIEADCKPAPAVTPPTIDALATPGESKPQLGKKAIQPVHIASTHEEHEIESLGPPPEHTGMFFTIYFAMTGLHGI